MNRGKKKETSKLSKLRLRSTASVCKKSVSPHANPREKISSYFSSSLEEIAKQNESEEILYSNTESQYAQNLNSDSNVDNNSNDTVNDENDFANPKNIKPTRVLKVQKESKPRKRTRNTNDMKRFIKNLGPSCSDTNQEHLQLALAMSESMKEFENSGQSSENQEDVEYLSPYPSTQQKLATIKSTLDQFGFKSDRSPIEIPAAKNNSKQKKKFKFLTPSLFLRTEEDRTKLIETKVSGILTNISVYNKHLEESELSTNNEDEFVDNKPKSFLLREYYNESSTIFRKDNLSIGEMKDSTFYSKIVPQEFNKAGVLLKDWHSIPGREKTPPLESEKSSPINIIVEETEEYHLISCKAKNPPVNIIVEETEDHLIPNKEPSSMHVEEIKEHHSMVSKEITSPINMIVEETEENHLISSQNKSSSSTINLMVEETEEFNSFSVRYKSPALAGNIVVEETEEIQNEIKRKQGNNGTTTEKQINRTENIQLLVNASVDHCISPDLFSDSDLELSINKSPIKNPLHILERSPVNTNIYTINSSPDLLRKSVISTNLDSSPIILQTCNSNRDISPICVSSNSYKLEISPDLCEKEIFSDDSDAKSLSLLDHISPRRNKNKSPKKKNSNFGSSSKKSLFGIGNSTLNKEINISIDGIIKLNDLRNNLSPTKCSSPVKTFEKESQICHYESFCDNDYFDLTRSSEDSNDIFNAKTIINPLTKDNDIDDEPISENIFASEAISTEMGAHDDNYTLVIQTKKYSSPPKEDGEPIDLTQSPNDSKEAAPKKNTQFTKDIRDFNEIINNYEDDAEETILLNKTDIRCSNNIEDFEEINTVPLQNKYSVKEDNNLEDESNDSVKTVLLKKNDSVNNIKDFEELNIVPLQKPIPNLKSDSFEEEYSPEFDCLNPSNNKLFYSSLSFISDSESEKDKSPKKTYSRKDKFPINNHSKKTITADNSPKLSPKKITSLETEKIPTIPKKKSVSPNIKSLNKSLSKYKDATQKKGNKLLNTSFNENIIGDKEFNFVSQAVDKTDFFKLSSPLNVTNFFSQPAHKNNMNYKNPKDTDDCNQSFEDVEISDEELNYSVRKSNKFNINSKKIDISKSSNYLEINDEELNFSNNKTKPSCSKIENVSDLGEKYEVTEDVQFLSQSSIEANSDISDEELNYSANVSFKRRKLGKEIDDIIHTQEFADNVESFQQFDFNDLPYNGLEPTRTSLNINETLAEPDILEHPRIKDLKTPSKLRSSSVPCIPPNDPCIQIIKQISTTHKIDENIKRNISPTTLENNVKTPENNKVEPMVITPMNDYIIKTTDVTPMPNFNEMDSLQLTKELDKYGIKPLKRAKGIKLLRYIYEATHPVLQQNTEKIRDSSSDEEDNRIIKRRKKHAGPTNIQKRLSKQFENEVIVANAANNIAESISTQKQLRVYDENKQIVSIDGNAVAKSEKVEDMIFERKQSVKIASCRLPLHIAWHNLLSCNQELYEKIQLYEPIQVEEIYAQLKSFGYKYHIQDIITFLDRKCITIRVAQNQKKAGS